MNHSKWYLRFAFASLLLIADSSNAKPKIDCPTIYKELYAHSAEMLKDLEKHTQTPYWGRARAAISASSPEALNRIFGTMSKADFEDLFFGIKSGAIKATREEEQMVDELWHMIDDLGEKPFWGSIDRTYAIKQALEAHDIKLSYSGEPSFAAQLTEKALGKTEVEIIARALSEHEKNAKYANSKWYDRMVRFFSPHYDKVIDILRVDNSIRRRLQKMYEVDKPALEAIPKYKESLSLTEADLKALQGQVSDTGAQLQEARADIQNLYGREVSQSKPLPEQEVRIRELAKRAKAIGSHQKEGELTAVSESDMDTIDDVIGRAWNRKNKVTTGMPVEEKHDVHLQIRNIQYRRETPELRAVYFGTTESRMPNRADYNVKTEWDVTVYHKEMRKKKVPKKDANGNDTNEMEEVEYEHKWETEYVRDRNDVLKARYEEVLKNEVKPRSHMGDLPDLPAAQTDGSSTAYDASNGPPRIVDYDTSKVQWILEQGKNARASETPYRNQIANATTLVDGITNDGYKTALKTPTETKKIFDRLKTEEASLRETRARLATYHDSDSGKISSQWAYDKEKDFKDRNRQMIDRYDHMIKRVVHLAEQIRRQTPSLEIEYTLPSYEPQLARLKAIKDKNRKIIVGTTATAGLAAAGATGFVYRKEIGELIEQAKSKNSDRSYNQERYDRENQ